MLNANIMLLSGSADLNLKVLYCLFPVTENIHIIANQKNSILKYSRYKKRFRYIPWSNVRNDQDDNIEAIMEYCKVHEIDLLLPGDISASSFLHRYRDRFEQFNIFPVMDYGKLQDIDNKWKFAERLMCAEISTPKTMYLTDVNQLGRDNRLRIEKNIGFPLMIKPLFGESGHGVRKLENFEQLKDHVYGNRPYSGLPLIIQSYIDGYDIDASFIADDGIISSIAVQKWKDDCVLEFKSDVNVEALSAEVVKLFEYSGAGHIDMRVEHESGKVYAIEFNPRFWFTITPAMWQGLNFVEAAVNYSLGREYKKKGATGDIRLPGGMIKWLIRKPWDYYSFSRNERESLWQSLLDPIPHLVRFIDSRVNLSFQKT